MKKGLSVLGMISGIVIVILAVLLIMGVFGGKTRSATPAPYYYDSGYAQFGADFYNYVSNNAAEAGSGSLTAANNLDEIGNMLRFGLGFLLLGFGLLMICLFGGNLGKSASVTVYQANIDDIIQKSVEKALISQKEIFTIHETNINHDSEEMR